MHKSFRYRYQYFPSNIYLHKLIVERGYEAAISGIPPFYAVAVNLI